MKPVVTILAVAVAIGVAFFFVKSQRTTAVIDEVLSLVDRMDLTAAENTDVKQWVRKHHETVYALEEQGSGGRPSADAYLDKLFDQLVTEARSAGNTALAKKLQEERELVSLSW